MVYTSQFVNVETHILVIPPKPALLSPLVFLGVIFPINYLNQDCLLVSFFFFFCFSTKEILLLIYLALPGLSCSTWDLSSSLWHAGFLVAACDLVAACGTYFLDQGSNLGPCIESMESWLLDHQGSPCLRVSCRITQKIRCGGNIQLNNNPNQVH